MKFKNINPICLLFIGTLFLPQASPMLIHVTRGRLMLVRGDEINFFKAGDAFIESNNGAPHYVKNVGKKPAILHVGVVSIVGMPTAINK